MKGQQRDLYKNILVNSLQLINPNGFLGLVHPTSVYDDAKGDVLRGVLYSHLKYVFHFRNELKLFSETNDKGRLTFALNIYSGDQDEPNFTLISNLFHPSTIDGCFIPSSNGEQTIKVLKSDGKFGWNLQSNFNRRVIVDEELLKILSEAQDGVQNPKLIYLQTNSFRKLIKKIAVGNKKKLGYCNPYFSKCFDETNDVGEGEILIDINHQTKFPELERFEFIYNGPHFTILNPIAQSPKVVYNSNNDYQVVDLTTIDEFFLPNTKYLPNYENGFNPILNVLENKPANTVRTRQGVLVGRTGA